MSINIIPLEILAHIWQMAAKDSSHYQSFRSNFGQDASGVGYDTSHTSWRLTHVCSMWRQCVAGIPLLWNELSLNIQAYSRIILTNPSIDLNALLISRTRDVTISAVLYYGDEDSEPQGGDNDANALRDAVLSGWMGTQRCHRLDIYAPARVLSRMGHALGELQNLRALRIARQECVEGALLEPGLNAGWLSASSISTLDPIPDASRYPRLERFSLLGLPWDVMTVPLSLPHLELTQFYDAEDIADLLYRHGASLETAAFTLHFETPYDSDDPEDPEDEKAYRGAELVTLPLLRKLCISVTSDTPISYIYHLKNRLVFPALTHLLIEFDLRSNEDFPEACSLLSALASVFNSSNCEALQQLSVDFIVDALCHEAMEKTTEGLIMLLATHTNVTHLFVRCRYDSHLSHLPLLGVIPDAFFERLIFGGLLQTDADCRDVDVQTGNPNLLPQLTHLCICGEFPSSKLFWLVTSRTAADPFAPLGLNCLTHIALCQLSVGKEGREFAKDLQEAADRAGCQVWRQAARQCYGGVSPRMLLSLRRVRR